MKLELALNVVRNFYGAIIPVLSLAQFPAENIGLQDKKLNQFMNVSYAVESAKRDIELALLAVEQL